MKQIAQYQDGRLEVQEVPCPTAPPGGVLVRTTHSVISIGTEKMKVEQAKMNLFQKARARPDQVRKVVDTAKTLGWRSALEKVRNRLRQHVFERLRDHFQFVAESDADAFGSVIEGEDAHVI